MMATRILAMIYYQLKVGKKSDPAITFIRILIREKSYQLKLEKKSDICNHIHQDTNHRNSKHI